MKARWPLMIALTVAPAVFAAWMVARYAVNMPFWDEWVFATFISKAKFGGLSFRDFWEQYNESRKIFPRIVMIIIARLTNFDVRAWMWFSLCLVGATFLGIVKLARMTNGDGKTEDAPCENAPQVGRLNLAVASLLLFSPTQYQNFLWGIQIVVFIPATCLIWGLVAAQSRLALWKKWTIARALAFIATYSYSNGLLCWQMLLPVLWKASPKNRRTIFSAIWIAIAALSVAVYRFGIPGILDAYVKPNWTPSLDVAFHHPLDAIKFFLAFLGQPLAETFEPLRFNRVTHISDYCAILGFFFLAAFTTLSLLAIRKCSGALPWICFGAYTLFSGILTTFGRLGFGADFDVTPRYRTFGLYMLIATIYLATIIAQRLQTRRITLHCAFTTALCILFLIAAPSGVRRAEAFHTRQLQGKAALEFINIVDSPAIRAKVADQYSSLLPLSNLLDRAGYLHPPLINARTMEQIAAPSSEVCGQIESIRQSAGTISLSGWAVLPSRREPADAVIFAFGNNSESRPFAIITDFSARPEVAKALSESRYINCGWSIDIATSRQFGNPEVSAWAIDSATGQAHRLAGSVKLAETP